MSEMDRLGDWIRAGREACVAAVVALCTAPVSGCSDDGAGTETEDSATPTEGTTAGPNTESGTDSDTVGMEGDPDPGTVILRRLNNVEYNNTVQDLLLTEQTPADNFPTDQISLGFDIISAIQSLSPLQAELYELAADGLIEEALFQPTVDPVLHHFEIEDDAVMKSTGGPSGDFWNLWSNGDAQVAVQLGADGEYRIRVRAAGQLAGPDLPNMEVRLGGQLIDSVGVDATPQAPELFEWTVQASAGNNVLSVGFTNDFYDPMAMEDRNLLVDYMEIEGPIGLEGESNPQRDYVLVCDPGDSGDPVCLEQIISTFGRRALRRPLTADELARLMAFIDEAEQDGDTWEEGLRMALKALLVSPHFLFRVELDPAPADTTPHPVGAFELATRMSYFLWSSMPDDTLLDAAASGELETDAQIAAQVARMLDDEKSFALVENYAGQWLKIRAVWDVFKDPSVFPQFEGPLREAMVEEMTLFSEELLLGDRTMTDLVLAKDGHVNDVLAAHYGIAGVNGQSFVPVQFDGVERQGVLTQAGLLSVLSHATHNSPVKRGEWIMDNMLCQKPPPPPEELDIPPLEPVEGEGPLRDQLEQHRADPLCSSCHQYMDPLGFALEDYDAIGAYRTDDNGFPIDASGEMISGVTFDGAVDLSDKIAEDEGFHRCLAEKAFIYALGRDVHKSDEPYLDDIEVQFELTDYMFRELALAIVTSDSFRMRRGEEE